MLEKAELPAFIRLFFRNIYSESVNDVEFARKTKRTIPYGQRCNARMSCEWFVVRHDI